MSQNFTANLICNHTSTELSSSKPISEECDTPCVLLKVLNVQMLQVLKCITKICPCTYLNLLIQVTDPQKHCQAEDKLVLILTLEYVILCLAGQSQQDLSELTPRTLQPPRPLSPPSMLNTSLIPQHFTVPPNFSILSSNSLKSLGLPRTFKTSQTSRTFLNFSGLLILTDVSHLLRTLNPASSMHQLCSPFPGTP
jgi:hypothetical protein